MTLAKAKAIIGLSILSLALLPGAKILAQSCAPCGEVMTNLPMPSYDTCGVAPFQNYIATYSPGGCGCSSGRSGFYIGTGVGYGQVDYRLTVPGITLIDDGSRSYMTEFLAVGYGYGKGCFFIGGELAYYYSSVTKPFFYEDDTSFITVSSGEELFEDTVTVRPCTARIDISSQNRVALDVLPGFNFGSNFTIFGRLGAEFGSYSWRRRICIPDVVLLAPVLNIPLALTATGNEITDKETDTIGALRIGAGLSYAVSPNVSFQVNYIHVSSGQAEFVPNRNLIFDAAPFIADGIFQPDDVDIEDTVTNLLAKNTVKTVRNEILLGVKFTF